MVERENKLKGLINVWTEDPRVLSGRADFRSPTKETELSTKGQAENVVYYEREPSVESESESSEAVVEPGFGLPQTAVDRSIRDIGDVTTHETAEPDFDVPVEKELLIGAERLLKLSDMRIEGRTDDGAVTVILDGRGRFVGIKIAERLSMYPSRIAPKLMVAISRGRVEAARRSAGGAPEKVGRHAWTGFASPALTEGMADILAAGTKDIDMPAKYRAVVDEALEDLTRVCDKERSHARKLFEEKMERKAGTVQMSGEGDVVALELNEHAVRDLGVEYLGALIVAALNRVQDTAKAALVQDYMKVSVGGVELGENLTRVRNVLGL
ncbi:YbaB/EbfC family nucleoid-associated protein [Actinomadura sp. NTSP31]|uniref:YbaB/EbfC family nucleoid-associated protein n=1 Tax=Actinomadura sp. NTSP31 TaxID=1735447 RepID=UPI0035C16312